MQTDNYAMGTHNEQRRRGISAGQNEGVYKKIYVLYKNMGKKRESASIHKAPRQQRRSQWDELQGRVTEFTGCKITWREEGKDKFFLMNLIG